MERASHGRRGLLAASLLCLIPVLIARTSVWPFLALCGLVGGVRSWYRDPTLRTDCIIICLASLVREWKELRDLTKDVYHEHVPPGSEVGLITRGILFALVCISVFYVPKGLAKRTLRHVDRQDSAEFKIKHPKPLVFPCRTTHARVFPKRHAFGYSYLLYGIPVIPGGIDANGQGLVDGKDRRKGNWWLQVRAEDYLKRGYGELGFYGKLKMILQEHGVPDSEWSYAYLVTAPRFLGYSFNPVSFWYVYSQSHELRRMILEVNNTFGERRMYVLDGSGPPTPPRTPEHELPAPQLGRKTFTDAWKKDFHVSPFNSRKGSYALKALDPFVDFPNPCAPKIDNTITLKSSKDHAKIVARVHSTGTPVDARALGFAGTVRFVGSWWWVGLLTFPRILKEAFKLFFKRSLHVWFRPEVMNSSIGRAPTAKEMALQEIFHAYLQHQVEQSPHQWDITYHTAIPSRPKERIISTYNIDYKTPCKKFEIHVLTPAFYSRFVHYAFTSEAFDRECLFTDERNRTLWISEPELLAMLLSTAKKRSPEDQNASIRRTYADEMRWRILRRLRCSPADPAYPLTPNKVEFSVNDIRIPPYSELDTFMQSHQRRFLAGTYRRITTELFLAQRLAFGFAEIVDVLDLVVRIVLCLLAANVLNAWSGRSIIHELGGPQDESSGALWGKIVEKAVLIMPSLLGTGVLVSSCHVYGLAKGYV